jgi:tricarballylate dehydrogenase
MMSSKKKYNSTYDVVVVGAGNAALCAALSAQEEGCKVLVLEKGTINKRGGNSFFSDGSIRFAYSNLNDIREVVTSITDEEANLIKMPPYHEIDYICDLMRVTSGKSDPSLAKQLVAQSYETIKWIKDQGVQFTLNYENQSFKQDGNYLFWGGSPVRVEGKGVGLMEKLFSRIEEVGIEIWYNTRALELVNENEKIAGIIVKQEGKKIRINTSSVILACGSFEANEKMRQQYMGAEWGKAIVRGTEHNTGDGISMAIAIGAQRYGQWKDCHSIGTDYNAPKVGDFTKPGDIFKKHSYPYGIMLNKEGKRFIDEGADFRNYTYAKYGREILKQPDHIAYQVYDAQVRSLLRKEYNIDEATCYQANTLEELINLLPVNREQFLLTVQDYNASVLDGEYNPTVKDGKGTKDIIPPKTNWALPIEKGPFYAFPVACGITFTFGGLKVNAHAEVLNENDKPLNGLFAAGEIMGGIFYENYPGGTGLMAGSIFGKIAGESVAQYIQDYRNHSVIRS